MIVQDEFSNSASTDSEFEEYIDHLADPEAPEIEIDSVSEVFGELYRVWNGSQLLGTLCETLRERLNLADRNQKTTLALQSVHCYQI